MIPQETIDKIHAATDIVDVISQFMPLKKKGINHIGNCPFHAEKTGSFSVSQSKGIFKCFGCGMAGNAVKFLMEHEKLSYPEALKWLAGRYKIVIEELDTTPEQKQLEDDKRKRKDYIITVLKVVQDFYAENLKKSRSALEYLVKARGIRGRIIKSFRIGLAPGDSSLVDYLREQGFKQEKLLQYGILKESKHGKLYDPFYNRIIFPIWDRFGNPVGFTGRILPELETKETTKYRNSDDSEVFRKGNILYGYHLAQKTIREAKTAFIVEGNTDTTRLHQYGRANTVAQMGTALTTEQITLLKKSGAENIVLCYDSDPAGYKATIANGEALVKAGFSVEVEILGDWGESGKVDPDTFFKSIGDADGEPVPDRVDYIAFRFQREYDAATTPAMKSSVIKKIIALMVAIDEHTAQLYIEELGKVLKIKKQLTDGYRREKKQIEKTEKESSKEKIRHTSSNDDEMMLQKYGFIEERGKYWFNKLGNYGSNFTLKPLFHVESSFAAKRIFVIKNEYGYSSTIEFDQKDLISLSAFKLKVESLGNFLWLCDEACLTLLKSYLYENTETCRQITQLGWQDEGFWAWGNGVFYKNHFTPVDENGVVKLDIGNFYIPAFSQFFLRDKNIYEAERAFVHRPEGKISLYQFSEMMMEVFGENAIVIILFFINTLFRDIIVKKTNNFPILNLFGIKGTGKSEMYKAMLQAFGYQNFGPNINSSSKAALGDHVSQFANALCPIEEYKNSIEFEKVEFLKGTYNSTGRTKMNMDKDKKKETTKADVGIVLAGQEMPTADVALFSRLLYVCFFKTEFSKAEEIRFKDFIDLATKNGFTNITHEILSLREQFKTEYDESWEMASELLTNAIDDIQRIEGRILKNWQMILAGYLSIERHIRLAFNRDSIVDTFSRFIVRQNNQVKGSSEISLFWTVAEFLYKEGLIENEIDFKIVSKTELKTIDSANVFEFNPPKNVLMMDTSRVFALYRKHAKAIIEQPLPMTSLEYYVKNSKEFLGRVHSVRFKVKDPNTGRMYDYKNRNDEFGFEKPKCKVTRAFAFDYDMLEASGVNIHNVEANNYLDDESNTAIFEDEKMF